MTATPLIKDQSVVALPPPGAVRADAATVGSTMFAEIFAAINVTGLHGLDRQGGMPTARPSVPAAGVEEAVSGDPVMGDVALFAEMMHRAKAGLVMPDTGDPSDIPQAADVAILGEPEGHLALLRLIGDPGATDIPVDLDKVVAYLARLLTGDASDADAALLGDTPEDVPLEAVALSESGGDLLAASGVEMALMQVDGRLAIMGAGALGRVSGEIAAYAETIGLAASLQTQTTEQTAPLEWVEGEEVLAHASARHAITVTMPVASPEERPSALLGQVGAAFVPSAAPIEKPSVPIAWPEVPVAVVGQKNDIPGTGIDGNSTVKPDGLSGPAVSGDPVIRIAGLGSGAEVAGTHGEALDDGVTFQPSQLGHGPTPGLTSLFMSGPQPGPADQDTVQTAPVVPIADRDLMYLDVARSNVVSAAPLVAGGNMKTGRMRSLEQAGGQQSELRSGLVPQPLAGSDIFGTRTAGQASAAVTRMVRGEAPSNNANDKQPAKAQDQRGTGQVASDMAGPPVGQSGTQPSALPSGAASAVPMAQSSGLPAMLDVRRQGWTQTLVQRAAGMVQSGGVLTLKILPQHLGQITLKMSEGRRGLDLRIVAEVASTAAMLRGVESQISSAFEGAGLMLGEFSANTGKDGGSAFGDDADDGYPPFAGRTDADETDVGMISNETAQHSLLNILL